MLRAVRGGNSKEHTWEPLDPKQVRTMHHASLHPQNSSKVSPKHPIPRVSLFFLEINSNKQTTHSITKHRCYVFSPTPSTLTLCSIHVAFSVALLASIPLPGLSSLSLLCAWMTVKVLIANLCLTLCNSMDWSPQAPLSMEFSRQEYWSR